MPRSRIQTHQTSDISFGAYNPNASGTAIPNAVFTHIDFQTEEFDTHGYYDAAAGTFTPKVPGRYQINAFVSLLSVADQATIHVAIRKNGANIKWNRGRQSGTGEFGQALSSVVDLNGTTDYVDIAVWTSGGATNVGGSQNNVWFNGHKV